MSFFSFKNSYGLQAISIAFLLPYDIQATTTEHERPKKSTAKIDCTLPYNIVRTLGAVSLISHGSRFCHIIVTVRAVNQRARARDNRREFIMYEQSGRIKSVGSFSRSEDYRN